MKIQLDCYDIFDALSDMGFAADPLYTTPENRALHALIAEQLSPVCMAELEKLAKFLGQHNGRVTIESRQP